MARTGKSVRFEHVLRPWEIKYGYLGFKEDEDWRSFFSPVIDEYFDITVLGYKTFSRKVDEHGRMYVGRSTMKTLEPGDTVVVYRDAKGNYYVEKKT